jgi:hypothetical protein
VQPDGPFPKYNRSAMGSGTILQYKALKVRGKTRWRKSNEKQWQKQCGKQWKQ